MTQLHPIARRSTKFVCLANSSMPAAASKVHGVLSIDLMTADGETIPDRSCAKCLRRAVQALMTSAVRSAPYTSTFPGCSIPAFVGRRSDGSMHCASPNVLPAEAATLPLQCCLRRTRVQETTDGYGMASMESELVLPDINQNGVWAGAAHSLFRPQEHCAGAEGCSGVEPAAPADLANAWKLDGFCLTAGWHQDRAQSAAGAVWGARQLASASLEQVPVLAPPVLPKLAGAVPLRGPASAIVVNCHTPPLGQPRLQRNLLLLALRTPSRRHHKQMRPPPSRSRHSCRCCHQCCCR